jgi:hypothetical protein
MVTNPKTKERAVFAAVRHPDTTNDNVFTEIKNINKYSEIRPYATLYKHKLYLQGLAYKSYEEFNNGLKFNKIFDGSLLVHDLKSAVAKDFRKVWYRQYMDWSDRDQVSGAFALGTTTSTTTTTTTTTTTCTTTIVTTTIVTSVITTTIIITILAITIIITIPTIIIIIICITTTTYYYYYYYYY